MIKRITPYLEHLKRLSFEVDEDNLVGYYKNQFEAMKEDWEQTYELAQLELQLKLLIINLTHCILN